MNIVSKTNVVEIKNKMERGYKILQQTIWTLNYALLYIVSRPLEMKLDIEAAALSMTRLQNFHKKLDFLSFVYSQEQDYPSFERK